MSRVNYLTLFCVLDSYLEKNDIVSARNLIKQTIAEAETHLSEKEERPTK